MRFVKLTLSSGGEVFVNADTVTSILPRLAEKSFEEIAGVKYEGPDCLLRDVSDAHGTYQRIKGTAADVVAALLLDEGGVHVCDHGFKAVTCGICTAAWAACHR